MAKISNSEVLPSTCYRVLIVEDDVLQCMELQAMLDRAGYDSVGPFRTNASALAAIKSEKIDAVLLDVKLSEEKAFAIADTLVSEAIPFIIVTGYPQEVLPEKYRQHRVLYKPVPQQKLMEALQQVFNAGP